MGRTGESIDVRREDPIRVVLAEDHAEFRLGLKEMLATDGGIEVVGEAENGARAVALVSHGRHRGAGTDPAGGLSPPGIVILTMYDQPHLRRELMRMGASAFLAKSASLAELIGAVKGSRRKRTLREGPGEETPTS